MEILLENLIRFESGKLREPSGMKVNKDGQVFVTSSSESVSKVSNSYSKVFVFNEKGKFQNSFQIDGTDADLGTDLTSVHWQRWSMQAIGSCIPAKWNIKFCTFLR